MLHLRRLAPALARNGGGLRELSTTPALLQGAPKDKKDDDTFELLPPGCSIVDPSYGLSPDDKVYHADPVPPTRAAAGRKPATPAPTSLAEAQAQLKDKKEQKKKEDEEEPYVYLPPGSSMREPGYNSMSDPVGGRVYYRDPIPVMRKK